jgi:hypothetical protein
MSGWGRVDDDTDPGWKAVLEEAEREFFGHDAYGLLWPEEEADAWSEEATVGSILAPVAAEPNALEAIGEVRTSKREIRIGNLKFKAVVDVRRDRSPWPRRVVKHQTEQIATIRRSRGLTGRQSWSITDAAGETVATLTPPAYGLGGTGLVVNVGNRQVGVIGDGPMIDLSADPGRELDRRLALAAFVSIVLTAKGF